MTPTDKLIDKLQKLYAKAESATSLGNEAEALAFMGKVNELLKKHKMDASVLTDVQVEKDEPMGQDRVTVGGKKSRVQWTEQLAGVVARAFYCNILVTVGSDRIIIVGRLTDRQVAEYVFVKLVNFIEAECKRQHGKLRYDLYHNNNGDMSGAHGFKASFRRGAVQRIRERLRELRTADVASDNKFALVVTKSTEEVQQYIDERYGRSFAPASKGQRGSNKGGYDAGRSTGDRADISGRGVGTGSPTKSIS